jgi:Tol biopolymer transport system component
VAISPSPQSTPRGGGHGQLAFASERTGGRPQIFLMDLDGSNVRQLTSLNDGACQPAWSPDGQRVLFVSPCAGKRDSYPGSALYIMNADGTNPQPLGATIQLVGGAYDADWSAISGIAVTGLENNQPRVYVAKDSDTRAVRISESLSTDSHPSWSPDGERLVFFNRSRAGTPTLYWMFKDGTFSGTRPDQVTQNQVVAAPAWSPGGDLIAYVVNSQIMVIRWDAHGFNFLPLTTRGPNADPRWSPDGNWITFESWRDAANHDIYTMTAGGGQQTRLTDDPAQDYQPAWRP